MTLPAACAVCIFSVAEGRGARCHRHAPGTDDEPEELTIWPKVKLTDRCGSGSDTVDKDNALTRCGTCIHWLHPDDGLAPMVRQGRSVEWWKGAGICTRFAPGTVREEESEAFWRVTSSDDGCGDGEAMEGT